LFTFLRRQGKAYQSRSKSLAGRGHIKNRVSIEERPDVVDEKSRVGDWEIDLVIGKADIPQHFRNIFAGNLYLKF